MHEEPRNFVRPPMRPLSSGADRSMVVEGVAPNGRGAYTGREVVYGVSGGNLESQPRLGPQELFYNANERLSGTAFLTIGDEVVVFKRGNRWVCYEEPRGVA